MSAEPADDDIPAAVPTDRRARWRLALGVDAPGEKVPLTPEQRRMDKALSALYGAGERKGRGGLGGSAPRVAKWLGDVREFFPQSVVRVIQQDAFDRLGLQQMLLEPEFLATVDADVHLVASLISLRGSMPKKTKETAREVIAQVVAELMKQLESRTTAAIRGALNRSQRTYRPRFNDIDWHRTIAANLRHYQAAHRTVVPEKLVGFARHRRRRSELDEVILCVDQSGSMATSVVYASIFAAVMASIPSVRTRLVVFDTSVLDLTEDLADPVEVLFGVQLGGGTDINQALAYCESLVQQPSKTHLVLISDMMEGGDQSQMRARAASMVRNGVNLITLLALSDDGKPWYDEGNAQYLASLGAPVFACTPNQFPDLMGAALRRADLDQWASEQDIALVRPGGAIDPEA
jgi:Mg-chelatase subunit ChlD